MAACLVVEVMAAAVAVEKAAARAAGRVAREAESAEWAAGNRTADQ